MKGLCFFVVVLFSVSLYAQTNNAPKAADAATAHNQHTDQAETNAHPYGDFTLHNPSDPGNENGHPFGNPTFRARNANTHHGMPAPGSFTEGMIDRTTLMGQSVQTGLSSTTAKTANGSGNTAGTNQQQSGNNTSQDKNANNGSNQQAAISSNKKKQGLH